MSFERATASVEAPCIQFLPGLSEEQEELAKSGEYKSYTFSGWDIDPARLAHAQQVVAHAYFGDPSSREAEAYLGKARDVWLHSVEVAGLTVLALEQMNASEEMQLIGAKMGLWHDVGKEHDDVKAAIDGPHKLTREQRRVMEQHTVFGADLANKAGANPWVVIGTLLHHAFINENDEKRPYPHAMEVPEDLAKIVNEHLPYNDLLQTMIAVVAVADHFSAMSIGGKGRAYHQGDADPAYKLGLIARELNVPYQVRESAHKVVGVPLAA